MDLLFKDVCSGKKEKAKTKSQILHDGYLYNYDSRPM